MKKILNFLKPVLRGAVKSLPGGNVITEVVDNIKAQKEDKPHNWYSITIQVLCIAAIIYAFVSKSITIEDFLRLINE